MINLIREILVSIEWSYYEHVDGLFVTIIDLAAGKPLFEMERLASQGMEI